MKKRQKIRIAVLVVLLILFGIWYWYRRTARLVVRSQGLPPGEMKMASATDSPKK